MLRGHLIAVHVLDGIELIGRHCVGGDDQIHGGLDGVIVEMMLSRIIGMESVEFGGGGHC